MEKFYKMKKQRLWSLLLLSAMFLGFTPKLMAQDPIPPTSIILNAKELELYCGDTAYLTATVSPATANQELFWDSSDGNLVGYSLNGDNCKLFIQNNPEEETVVTITVYSPFNESVRDTCEVTVKPTNFWFYTDIINLPVNWSYQVYGASADGMPFNELDLEWSFKGDDILIINDNKLLTSTGETGSCIVTATLDGESHSMTINVIDATEGTYHPFNTWDENLALIHAPSYLEIPYLYNNKLETIMPSNTGCLLSYSSSDTSVAKVDNFGNITWIDKDSPVTFTVSAPNGANASYDYIPENIGILEWPNTEGYSNYSSSLSDFNIYWYGDLPLTIKDGGYATVSYEGGEPRNVPLYANYIENIWPPYRVTIALSEVSGLGQPGRYNVIIPLGTIKNSEGDINPTLEWTFYILNVEEATYTVTPEPGEVKPYQVSPLYFRIGGGYFIDGTNWSDETNPYVTDASGNKVRYISPTTYYQGEDTYSEFNLGSLDEGTYTLVIPQGFFIQWNSSTGTRSINTEVRYTYTILPGIPFAELISPIGQYQSPNTMTDVQIEWNVEGTLTLNENGTSVEVYQSSYGWSEAPVNLDNNVLTINLSSFTFEANDYVQIKIPTGLITDETGDMNKSQTFYFYIYDQTNEYTADPEPNSEVDIPDLREILITFDEATDMWFNNDGPEAYILTEEGNKLPLNENIRLNYNYDDEVWNLLTVDASAVEEGTFTIVIPENYVVLYSDITGTNSLNAEIQLTYTVGGETMDTLAEITDPENYEEGMSIPAINGMWISFGEDAQVKYYDPSSPYIKYTFVGLDGYQYPTYTVPTELYNNDREWVNPNDEEGNIYGNQLYVPYNFSDPGTWTFELPAGLVMDENGAYNQKQIFQFVITEPEIPDYTITPAPGQVKSLESFTLTFGEDYQVSLRYSESAALSLVEVLKDGEPVELASISNPIAGQWTDEETGETNYYRDWTKLEFVLEEPQEEPATYSVIIPENLLQIYSYNEYWWAAYQEDISFEYVIPELLTSITLNPATDQELEVGETLTVKATVLPEEATNASVVWTLSEEDVVSIEVSKENPNEVTVTALADGETELVATAADGSGIFASLTITVYENSQEPEPDYEYVSKYQITYLYDQFGMANGATVTWESDGKLSINPDNELPVTAVAVNGTTNYTIPATVENNALVLDLSELPTQETYVVTIPQYYVLIGNDATNEKIEFRIAIDITSTGIAGIYADADGNFRVYDLSGRNILSTKDAAKVKELENGIYIINGKKVMLKK